MASNADVARRGYDALNRQDWEALQPLVTPDLELRRAAGLGDVQGADAVIGFAAPEAFDHQRFDVVDLAERGARLLVTLRVTARGAGSEVEVEQDVWHVVDFRDGRIARLEIHFDRDDAVAAFEAT